MRGGFKVEAIEGNIRSSYAHLRWHPDRIFARLLQGEADENRRSLVVDILHLQLSCSSFSTYIFVGFVVVEVFS